MLQKIRDRLTGWVALAILGTIAVTFVFVGGANFAFTGNNYAAKVDGVDVSIGQFEEAYSNQLQQNPQFAALPDEYRQQLRSNILEQLIQQRVIDNYIDEAGFQVSDEQITRLVQQQPEFQVDGKFDMEMYRTTLQNFNYTPATFEQAQRTTLRRGQLQRAIRGSSLLAPSGYRRFLNLAFEQRVVRTASIPPALVADNIDVTEEMVSAYYDNNPTLYQRPETADVEYVEIRRDGVAASVVVTDEQLTDYYESNQDQYLRDEQRQARHILTLFGDDEAAAEVVAKGLLQRAQAGEPFEDLAKTYSKDGGTAPQGGDLGALTQEQLPGELGDAIFSMREGEVGELVKSDFGFHVVRLDSVIAPGPLPLEQVRASLLAELQEQEAEGMFIELQRNLSDALFRAGDDIQSIADAIGAEVQVAKGVGRSGGASFAGNQRALDAIFDPTVLSGAQISEVTELDANRTAVFAVQKHNVATRLPLSEVSEQIAADLRVSQAETLLADKARQMVDALHAGAEFEAAAEIVGAIPAEPSIIARTAPEADQNLAASVFTALKPTQGKPTVGSVRNGEAGYTVFSLDAVVPGRPESIPVAERDAGKNQLVDQYGVGDFVAFVQALRANAEVIINEDALAAQETFQ